MASGCIFWGKSFPLLSKLSGLLLLSTITWGTWSPVHAQTPSRSPSPSSSPSPSPVPSPSPNQPTDYRPLTQDRSILSIQGGKRLVQEALSAISSQNYPLAEEKLQNARQVFNQLSGFYQELTSVFVGINTQISENVRQRAIETAQLRDEATFQLALVHRAKNQPELSVPLLIQVIRSQNPTSDLGKQAYQQLFELGFVDIEFKK
jgi:hypothetical protein